MKALILAIVALGGVSRSAGAADSSPQALDSMQQRVQACTPCHGREGRATSEGYYPRIAGKPAGYLYNQLLNFRDGRRHFPMMAYLTELQDEGYLREMAAYFAALHLPYPPPQAPKVAPAVLERGRIIVTEGEPARRIPACTACHGTRLLGVEPAVPGLLGLSQDYLVAQLNAWRLGRRRAQSPDCMAELVDRMDQRDLAAAAAWLSAQPVPSPPLPQQKFERPPPLRCGGVPQTPRAP